MTRNLFICFSLLLIFIMPDPARAQATDGMLRDGAYELIVSEWENSPLPNANATGLTYFSAYYTNRGSVLEAAAERFAAIRPQGNPDQLGVGLGDMRSLHSEMQVFPFLEGAERQAMAKRADEETTRLSQHPEPEVAAYASFHRVIYAIMNGEVDRAVMLLQRAKEEHADFLKTNREWQLIATQTELIVAQETNNPDVSLRIFKGFSFDSLTGSPFESGFLNFLAAGVLSGEDIVIAQTFIESLAEHFDNSPDISARFWQTYYLAQSVHESQHDMSDLAVRLFAATGVHASETTDISGEDLYFLLDFEMIGNPASHRQAILSTALLDQSTISPSDPYFGRLLAILSDDEAELGNLEAAQSLERRAVEQTPGDEATKLLAETSGLSDRDAFLKLYDEVSSISLSSDSAGAFALYKRLYDLALIVENVDVMDRTVAISVYAGELAYLGDSSESDRAFSAFIDIMREVELTDGEGAGLAYSSYKDHLLEIGKFSKAASIDRDIQRAFARGGIQSLADQIQNYTDGSELLMTTNLGVAAEQGLMDELLSVAELAEGRIGYGSPDVTLKMAAVAVESHLLLGDSESAIAVADRALAQIIASDFELPFPWFDLMFVVDGTLPELEEALRVLSGLSNELQDESQNNETALDRDCPELSILTQSIAALGCLVAASGENSPVTTQDLSTEVKGTVETEKNIEELRLAVVEAPQDAKIVPLQSLRRAVLLDLPLNTAALAEVDAGLALSLANANDARAAKFANSALSNYIENDLLYDPMLYWMFDILPENASEKIRRLEALRPNFENFSGREPVEAWLDLNLACITTSDNTASLGESAGYLARAYENSELWKRDIPGCDPFLMLHILNTKVESATHDQVIEAADDLTTVVNWLMEMTHSGSDANLLAHLIDVLVARAIGDAARAENRLETLLIEPYRSHMLQTYFVKSLEERNTTLASGELSLQELFGSPAELPILNSFEFDIEEVLRSLIGTMPPEDLVGWMEKHASIRFDDAYDLETTEWRLGQRDPEVLAAWSLEVANLCGEINGDPYLQDQFGCALLAYELAALSFADRAAGLNVARQLGDLGPVVVLRHSDETADPGLLAIRLRGQLMGKIDTAFLDEIDQSTIGVLAAEEPDWSSKLLSDPMQMSPQENFDWLKEDEAVVLLTLNRATVIRHGRIQHIPLDVSLRKLVSDVQILRGSARQSAIGGFDDVRLGAAWSLWEALIAPIEAELDGVTHIWLQAPPVLQQVPFEALVTRQPEVPEWSVGDPSPGWLIERFSVSVVPTLASISGLRAIPASAGSQTLLGLGAPSLLGTSNGASSIEALMSGAQVDPQKVASLSPLIDSADELKMLEQIVGFGNSTIYQGPALTHTSLAGISWTDYEVIVFATHGLVASKPNTPVRALLALSPGKPGDPAHVEPADIRSYDLDANLVILAACDTGIIDDPSESFGLSAFADSFFESGARTVVVSKWPLVSDEAWRFSVPLMESSEPGSISRQLRKVRISLLQSGDPILAHPAFWAALTVVGDVPISD